jgi:hypothetical protein
VIGVVGVDTGTQIQNCTLEIESGFPIVDESWQRGSIRSDPARPVELI